MNKLLTGLIILVFISLQAYGQQSQDTLYLKNGFKAVGILPGQSRMVNPDSLSVDRLNVYMDKAVRMRNTGRALTLSGVGVLATGFIVGIILMNTGDGNPGEDMGNLLPGFYVMSLGGLIGIPCIAAGIPIWVAGGNRMTKAELNLRKFNIVPEGSMALGVGITIRF